ncbi:MAG TPA: 5'/3'-nucleotidase SurE [Bacteroidales bacterium]|nr:5'/3'-nucleotidase SurE [Bacteroidales bacterium]HRX96623.1 5'/3'-nucleotidase SurE [Bacteroidales bacterium]
MDNLKPTILVTNDDGIFAPGIRKLMSIARQFGNVVVVAPDTAMSGMSHAITVKDPLRLRKIDEAEGFVEYSCNGTPVDSVKLGEKVVLKGKPDLVVSGINHGSNASVNVVYSGTMAAAIEACIDGIPSIGFSLLDYSHHADFSHVDEFVKSIIGDVLNNGLPSGVCLNVNIPAVQASEIKGIKVCKQAPGRWVEAFDERIDPYHRDYYWLTGVFEDGKADENSDLWALANNFVSVVPIQFDLTAHQFLSELKNRGIESEKS